MNELSPPDAGVDRQPIFNMPGVVLATLAVLAAIHFVRAVLLPPDWSDWVLLTFAFIPARFAGAGADLPGGVWAEIWTFVTYAFLHADITHLLMNSVWLAAFGTPLARRFGTGRFLLLTLAGAIAGAATFLAFHFGEPVPVIGASAAVSAQMAAASRFVFATGGPLAQSSRDGSMESYLRPAVPLRVLFSDRRFLAFAGVWFVINLAVGLIGLGDGLTIAWEAHIGGFVVGLALFPLLDPVGGTKAQA